MKYSTDEIVTQLKKLKPVLSEQYPLAELSLFGSYARGDQQEGSDIDILVDFNGSVGLGFFRLVNELEDVFQAKVDVISRKGIKPHYLPYIERNLIRI